MGRTKAVAKRRRVDDEEAEKKAMEMLLSIPQEQVEAAAAVATRESCQHWPKVEDEKMLPDWLNGLGKSMTVPSVHFDVLKALHEQIKEQTKVWASWSGSIEDPRKRAFGFLPETLGQDSDIREKLDISTPWSKDNNGEERKRNHRAMVVLEALPDGTREAIEYLCQEFSKQLSSNSNLQKYLQYTNLIAVQPNLHSGRELLPTHVDHPMKDGFGVIIVTIGMVGSGTILLQDYMDKQKRTMQVSVGQAYMLSGTVRDACTHGVVAASGHRESLNLRFGLHDFERGADHPITLSTDVLRYWETGTISENERKAG